MKKAISLILIVLMLFSVVPTAISAEDLYKPVISIETVEANPGETFDVDITLANNPGIVSANLKIAFDDKLTLVDATNGDVFSTLTYIPPKQLSSGGQITSSCQFAWTGFDIEDKDIKNGKILTLTFKVSDDVEIGESLNISITTESGDVIDKNLNAVLLSAQSTVEVVEKTEVSPLSISSVTGTPGEIVTLDVSLVDNPGIVSANLKIAFDEGLTLVGAENGDVFSTLTYIPPKQLSSGGQITSSCQFAWTGFDIEDKDIKDGVILSLDFKISEAAEVGGKYNVSILSESGDVIDRNLNAIILNAATEIEVAEADIKEPNSLNDFDYELTADGIIITGYNGSETEVIIGESYEIDGTSYDVVEIAESAFEANEDIKSVVIPATVEAIGDYAFYDCTSLVSVTVLGKDTAIGEVALGYYYISRKEDGVVEGFTIYGHEGSTAEEYAATEEEITFITLEEEKECTHNGGIATCVDKAVCELCGETYGSIDENNHKTVVIDEAIAPDCENTGLTEGSHCSACDTVIVAQQTVDKLGHDFTVFVKTVDYTCDKDGYDVYKCSRCDVTENKNFTDAACRPEADYTVIEKASCYKAGYKAILCSECKAKLETETIAKREHNIVDTTVATDATCSKEGVMNQKCNCAVTDEYEACTYTTTIAILVDANNHEGTANIVKNAKDATCYAEGYTGDTYWSCCDTLYAKGEATDKTVHNPADAVRENENPASCGENGSYEEVVYCSVAECKAEISRETKTIPATGEHNYATEVEGSRVPSTCKTAGKVTMKCGCGATKEVKLELDETNHETVVTDNAVASDCENTGLTEGSHCSACDTVIVAQKTVDKLGHDFTVFVETVDYTCDKDGYDVYKCSRCDVTENKNFTDAACRPEADYTVIEKASCYKAGYKAILCSECKAELETEAIAKREHNIVDTTVATDATCITEGVMNQKCNCAASDEYEACTYTTTRAISVDANNHEDTANVVKNAKGATCYAEGYTGDTYWSCCDTLYVKGKATDKIPHTPAKAVRENEVAATCYKIGSYDEVIYCSVEECKHEISRTTKTIKKIEHISAEAVTENFVDSTCYAEGSYDLVVYCSVAECEEVLSRKTETVGKKAHTPTEAVEENRIEASCAVDGSYDEVVYCSVKECKAEISRETKTIPATGEHNYATEVEGSRIPSTCKTAGKVTMKCGCGATEEVSLKLDKTNHETVVTDNAVASDCENTGLTEGSHCSACDTVIVAQKTVDKLGHDFTVFVETVDYTCDKDGYDVYKCSRCDVTENKNFTDAACRPEADYTVIEKASCYKAGYKAILCSECKAEPETEAIAKREHNIVDTTVATDATCITEGVMNQKCNCTATDEYEACTYTTTRAIPVDANNHEGKTEIRNVTVSNCHAKGYTGDTYCLGCNAKIASGKEIAIDSANHDGATEIRNAVTGNCGETGYTGDTYCLGCNTKIADGKEIPATENHDYEGKITKVATCKATGVMTYTCSVCGDSYTEEIAVDASNHDGETEVRNATVANCHAKGYTGDAYCLGCNTKIASGKEIAIDSANHDGNTEIRNAITGNCGEAGYTGDTYCLGCNTKIADGKEIPATENHDHEGKVTKVATCKATGVMTYTCSVCKDSYTEKIAVDANNHASVNTITKNYVEATCATEGYSGDECYDCCGTIKVVGSALPIDKENHENIVIDEAVNATCKDSGLTEGSHCESCGTVIIEQIIIEKAGHIETVIPEVAPDCINEGLTEGIECLICGEVLVPQESIAALGHIFTVISAVYDENNVGTIVYECTDCGYDKTEEVAFNIADAFELIDEAEEKLLSDELTDDEREKIEVALAEFKAFIETYVVLDEEGNVAENNLPLNDSDVMTQYNKLLVNLDNAINGREATEGVATWGDIISRLIELIIMLLDLVYKFVVYIKAN